MKSFKFQRMHWHLVALCFALLCTLSFAHAQSLYTQWPTGHWQDLATLTIEQKQELALQVQVPLVDLDAWRLHIQDGLQSLPCQSWQVEVPFVQDEVWASNYQGVLQLTSAQGVRWFIPWWRLADVKRLLEEGALVKSKLLAQGHALFVESTEHVSRFDVQAGARLVERWRVAEPSLRLQQVEDAAVFISSSKQLMLLHPETAMSLRNLELPSVILWAGRALSGAILVVSQDSRIWQYSDGVGLKELVNLSALAPFTVHQLLKVEAQVPLFPNAGLHWRETRSLLLLSANRELGSVLVMIKLPRSDQPLGTVALFQQESASISEAEARQLLRFDGWFTEFSNELYGPPTLIAGVWYQQLVSQGFALVRDSAGLCPSEPSQGLLSALHLHYGSAVYSERVLSLPMLATKLSVGLQQDNFVLKDGNSSRVVWPRLHEISARCLHCSHPLKVSDFPRQKLLAVYEAE